MGLGDKNLYILLLGGLLRELFPDSSTAVGDKVGIYVETDHGSQDLTFWVNGYGHIPHFYPRSGEHRYVAISDYFQEVAPQIETRLYKEAEQSEVDSPLQGQA
ncbi:putative signal peptide protein [Puccinia sorghi]|uniref:Putative signal peptide protein n=1 Tax=Puccinia sorghi TaxID=27349 RepID=A0A0L6VKF8_9BASI|nr:putative signal peptide protein [Puccinia sorghi]